MGPKVGDTVVLVPGKGSQYHECEAVVIAVDIRPPTQIKRWWVRVAVDGKDIGWFDCDEVGYEV